jgi:hypothetical protein
MPTSFSSSLGNLTPEAALGLLVCGLVVGFPLVIALAAAVLRAACVLIGVRQPDFLPAMGIVLATVVIQGMVMVPVAAVSLIVAGRSPTSLFVGGIDVVEMVILGTYLPLSALTHAALYTLLIRDCPFLRSLGVWTVQLGIMLVLAGVVGLGLFLLAMVS